MAVLVRDAGFAPEDWTGEILPLDALAAAEDLPAAGLAVDFPNDRDPHELAPFLDRLALVRVAFPASSDGRGFSIGRELRAMGYRGRLRAAGPLIADQFRFARRVGFDEVELPDEVAQRQPEAQWLERPQGSYQDRLLR
jgi:uncharacterized protein (DUF934 family)